MRFAESGLCAATDYVRFGSKADICSAQAHVRFTPNSNRESEFPQKAIPEGLISPQLPRDSHLRSYRLSTLLLALLRNAPAIPTMIANSTNSKINPNDPSPRPPEKPNHLSKKSIAVRLLAYIMCAEETQRNPGNDRD